jgi:hypothetical protein
MGRSHGRPSGDFPHAGHGTDTLCRGRLTSRRRNSGTSSTGQPSARAPHSSYWHINIQAKACLNWSLGLAISWGSEMECSAAAQSQPPGSAKYYQLSPRHRDPLQSNGMVTQIVRRLDGRKLFRRDCAEVRKMRLHNQGHKSSVRPRGFSTSWHVAERRTTHRMLLSIPIRLA